MAFAVGIGIGKYAWRPPAWWMVATLTFVFAAVYFRRSRAMLSSFLVLGGFAFTGALAIQLNGGAVREAAWLSAGEPPTVTAHVISEGEQHRESANTLHQTIDIETDTIQSESAMKAARFGVRLNIYAKDQPSDDSDRNPAPTTGERMTQFGYGQRIRFTAALNPPRNFRNAGAFDYAGYLRDEGIVATGSVKYSEIELLPGFAGSRFSLYLARIRRSILDQIRQIWPEQEAALMDAMLLGEKTFIERSTRVDFQRSGTYHMLIVAGLHVGIIATFTMWFFRRLQFPEFVTGVLTISLILLYAALTKEGSPVWRAALMIAVYLVARFLYRRRAVLNALGIAAIVLLVINPNALFGASFQMSFLCVALIAGIAVPFLENTLEPYARGLPNLNSLAWDRSLPPEVAQCRLDLRMILARLSPPARKWLSPALGFALLTGFRLAELAVISAVMQFGMALPMACYFHRATAVATFANLLAVPFLQLLMPASLIAIAVSYVSLPWSRIPAAIAALALQAIAGTVRWLGGIRVADMRLPTPAIATIVCSGFAILGAILVLRAGRRHVFVLVALASLVLSAVSIWYFRPSQQLQAGVLELTAIDVGQGDSLLLVLPDGHKLLVDSGGLPFWTHSQMDIGEDVVSPYLWSRGISHLDAIALTHAHADHMGGFPALIANFRPAELWLPEGIRAEEIRPLLEQAARFNVNVLYREAGNSFAYGGAQIRVLAPDPAFPIRIAHRNDESLVMKISYGKTSALLEADAERGTERLVASEHPEADVLKVAHHGSATSSEPELLDAVHPKFAVISVGIRNVYHHPRREVLQRLQQWKVITYRTDFDGATTFYLDGKNVTPQIALAH